MGTAAYGGKGFKEKGKGKWPEANRRRQLQTAMNVGVMPPPPPLVQAALLHPCPISTKRCCFRYVVPWI